MSVPKARQVIAHERRQFDNPNGGNGRQTGPPGGTPAGFWAGKRFNEYGISLPAYAPGSRITIRLDLTANHGGKFGFNLCPRTSNLDQACFDQYPLTRADRAGEKWFWMQTKSEVYTQDWVLPAGVSCPNGCVLQWQYIGMQSNIERGCDPAVCGAYSRCVNPALQGPNAVGPGCGTSFEVFRNCADIIIPGTSVNPPPVVPPPATPPPATPPPATPPPATPPPATPPPSGCRDTYPACPGWKGQCAAPGVATFCPCMCRGARTSAAAVTAAASRRRRGRRAGPRSKTLEQDATATTSVDAGQAPATASAADLAVDLPQPAAVSLPMSQGPADEAVRGAAAPAGTTMEVMPAGVSADVAALASTNAAGDGLTVPNSQPTSETNLDSAGVVTDPGTSVTAP
eukprot:gene4446-4701_t